MHKYIGLYLILILALTACAGEHELPEATASSDHGTTGYGSTLGTVALDSSCNEQASKHLNEGLALLHHMTYEDARTAFSAAAESDSECALSYWGQAMTFIHPLWPDQPSAEQFLKGQELIVTAKSASQKTKREDAYINAVAAYFENGTERTEPERLASFEQGWATTHEAYPDDVEAMAFYALAHMATASPSDKTFEKQRRAGEIARRVLEAIPDHPGGHHYTIHAYDLPTLADNALDVARNYGKIAPEVPHALHMPTHIFTRLGYWDESIDWNKRSAEAALKHPVNGNLSMHYMHALDYLAYAYLQQGKDEEAKGVERTMRAIDTGIQPHGAAAYTLSAVPARMALERQDWATASSLELLSPGGFTWDNFAPYEAITQFAKALGAAQAGELDVSEASVKRLEELWKKTKPQNAYWATQIEIQYIAAQAWLAYAKGDRDEALMLMKKSAALEGTTEKHAVTPGEVLPAVELLGTMLLDLNRPEEAFMAFETALARSPNRLNSLYGAGYAAELNGNMDSARDYYQQLLKLAPDAQLTQVAHAQAFMNDNEYQALNTGL